MEYLDVIEAWHVSLTVGSHVLVWSLNMIKWWSNHHLPDAFKTFMSSCSWQFTLIPSLHPDRSSISFVIRMRAKSVAMVPDNVARWKSSIATLSLNKTLIMIDPCSILFNWPPLLERYVRSWDSIAFCLLVSSSWSRWVWTCCWRKVVISSLLPRCSELISCLKTWFVSACCIACVSWFITFNDSSEMIFWKN